MGRTYRFKRLQIWMCNWSKRYTWGIIYNNKVPVVFKAIKWRLTIGFWHLTVIIEKLDE